jgi:hypothetical protein
MNIKISKNAHTCAKCESDFRHEQVLTSSVRIFEGALQREDFCAECWTSQNDKKAYSVWKTIYYDPNVEEEEAPEVFSPLRQLFYEAVEEDSRIEMAKAFIAAGLLRRQKVFRRIKESDESDGEIRLTLYTDRIGNRLIEVPDPQFTYAEMEEAGKLLLSRLHELETPEEDVADTPTEPEEVEAPTADDSIDEDSDSDVSVDDGIESQALEEENDALELDDSSDSDVTSPHPTEETAHAEA